MNLLASIQLEYKDQFERNVTWALAAGAAAGGLSAAASGSRLGAFFGWAVTALTIYVVAGGPPFDRYLARAMGALLPALGSLFPAPWSLAVTGMIGGALLVANAAAARAHQSAAIQQKPGPGAYLCGALFGAVLLSLGTSISTILSQAVRGAGLHWAAATVIAGAATALFVALAAAPAHFLLEPDAAEVRARRLLFVLHGDLATLCDDIMGAYRRCRELLAQLPADGARAELATVTERTVNDALELAGEWQQVETQLEESNEAELDQQLASLRSAAAAARDALARKQLEGAAAALAEQVERLGELGARRERVMARLKATAAELNRTRLSLLSLRSARTHLKATELLTLSRQLKSLSALESTRGELDSAVATGAELAAVEGA